MTAEIVIEKGPTVALVGIAVLDHVFRVDQMPSAATKHFASSYTEIVGGIAANAAMAVARLGGDARLITRIGDDPPGRSLRAQIEGFGVDCTFVRGPSGGTPVSAVFIDQAGERMIVNHKDPALFDGRGLPAGSLAGAKAVMADLRWPRAAGAALASAAMRGVPGVLDFDKAPESGGEELIESATCVIFAKEALCELTKADRVEDALDAVHWSYPDKQLAVTDGANGIHWCDRGEWGHVPAYNVRANDTLGAGDVFHGAAALALAEGQSFEAALRFANATAALKVTRPSGPKSLPRRAEVDHVLATV